MRNLLDRIPKHYLGFIALFLLVGATACEGLIQEGAREAVAAGREIRDLEDAELGPIRDKLDVLRFDEIEPRQQEIEDLYREIERIQRQIIDPLWNQVNDPWSVGGELFEAQEALQVQYGLIDFEYREIELESRRLERRFRDVNNGIGGFDPAIRQREDDRYELQRKLDRLYRFGQDPIDEVWKKVNSINSNPDGSFDSNQFEIEQINNKIASLHDEVAWLQSDLDNRTREKQDLRNNVQAELNDLYSVGRFSIDDLHERIAQIEAELADGNVAIVAVGTISSAEADELRAERDALLNALNADLAQIDSEIAAVASERSSTVAFYQETIDAKNLEINLLSSPGDSSASSTPETTGNDDQIADLQAEIDLAELDRAAALTTLDEARNDLQAERDELVAQRQPDIDFLNVKIADLDGASTATVVTTVIPDGLSDELEELRAKLARLEQEYTDKTHKLETLLATIDRELNGLNSDDGPVAQIYRNIDQLNEKLNGLYQASEQDQVHQNDAVNDLVARAERLQEELTTRARRVEEQLFEIDDQLQRLYRNGQDNQFDEQIAFNQAQRALEDRRFELDDRRWLFDQEQQDMYSQNNDPYRDIQEKADLIYATEVQPLQDRIAQLEEELNSLRDEERSLERQLRQAERTVREREREIEDRVFDILEAATSDPAAGGVAGIDGVVDELIDPAIDLADDFSGAGAPESLDPAGAINADGTVTGESDITEALEPAEVPEDLEEQQGATGEEETPEPVLETVQ